MFTGRIVCSTPAARLDIADAALNLVNHLTCQVIEFETRLASHRSLTDEENDMRFQFDDLLQLHTHLESLEKSIGELLKQSQQLANDRLIRISEQLAFRSKQITLEINQRYERSVRRLGIVGELFSRKRSISQMMESNRSFQTLFDQEERLLNQLERRMQGLEPLSNDKDQLRRMTKTVTVSNPSSA
jgi:hypothetical protein